MNFEFAAPVRLVFGEGVFTQVGERCAPLGRKALLVTGRSALIESGHVQRAIDLLAAAGLQTELFARVPSNPTADIVDEGAQAARAAGCDLVIGLGGGSAMDAAKAIAACAGLDQPCRSFMQPDADGRKLAPTAATLPVVCVTSTAGTASELTPFAVITIPESREKSAIRSDYIWARVALADPELTYSLPPEVTAATGVDVLCHAVEAYISAAPTPMTDLMCEEAIRLVGRYLPVVFADGSNTEARRQMTLANCLAGYGLGCCGATVMHALEHPVSGHYPRVAHGAGLAAFVLPWARKLSARVPERFARIGELLSGDAKATAATAEEALGLLLESVGLRVRLRELGVQPEDLAVMASDACRYMGGALQKTPGGITAEDCLELLEAAY